MLNLIRDAKSVVPRKFRDQSGPRQGAWSSDSLTELPPGTLETIGAPSKEIAAA